MRIPSRAGAVLLLLVAALAPPAPAQEEVTVTAGARYRASGLKRFLLGSGYRDAWAAPIRVPVLDLASFAGGLTPTEEGGGRATESLRFRGADGREYVFRSVDKVARRALPEDLQGSFVETIAQDLTSAKHPAAALAVPPVLQAVGVLHVSPALYLMPDDPRLGEFRERWRGRLGQLEVRLEDDLASVIFPGAAEMESTRDFLDELEDDPRNRADAAEYLKARLVDFWLGDWDRHPDQWRWVRFDRGEERIWRPVPRDRDNAFVRYEGLIIGLARTQRPNLVRYGPRMSPIYPMHYHSAEMDRKILPLLERAQWDSVTRWVQARLTDEVIEAALGRWPEEYRRLDAGRLREALVARREQLTWASAELYDLVVREAELHATDADERARVLRRADGSLQVEIAPRGGGPVTRRTFTPGETAELRLFLHGGDDELEIDGPAAGAIRLRVVGGGGDDRLAERSAGGGPSSTRFYDHRGENQIVPGRGSVDTRPWETPMLHPVGADPRAPRDYGGTSSLLTPHFRWQPNVGPVVGVGPSWTLYGFRRVPYARFWHLRGVYAPLVPHGYGAEVWGVIRRTGRPAHVTVSLRGNRFETWRFHGFGNRSPFDRPAEDYLVRHDFAAGEVLFTEPLGRGWSVAVGPSAAWRSPAPVVGAPVLSAPPGAESHLVGGGRLRLRLEDRDTLPVTRRGRGWTGEAFAAAWSEGAPFARLLTESWFSLPLGRGAPAFAARAGVEHVVGDFPFQEAASLGGPGRLRGYDPGRFLGESAYWGSAELRQPLGQVRFLVRGRLGALALADVGFVEVDGEETGDPHTSFGGGLWFETLGKVGTLTYARGEVGRVYFTLGLPF